MAESAPPPTKKKTIKEYFTQIILGLIDSVSKHCPLELFCNIQDENVF